MSRFKVSPVSEALQLWFMSSIKVSGFRLKQKAALSMLSLITNHTLKQGAFIRTFLIHSFEYLHFVNSHTGSAMFYEAPPQKMGQTNRQNATLLLSMVGKTLRWEESHTLWSGSARENIYAPIITYSCLASHDKRQEAQQLKGGEEISSFHEDQIVWNQTWFIFRGGDVKMFEQQTIPQSDDSFLRHKVLLRLSLEPRTHSFLSKLKSGPLIWLISLSV